MAHLTKLKLSDSSPHSTQTALDRMRLRLLQRLELQQQAAQAFVDGQSFTEEVERWVKHADTGEKTLIKQQRAVRRWWWQDQNGRWVITLRKGNQLLVIDPKKPSIEVGEKSDLPAVFETLIEATKAGELDASLNRTKK